MSNSLGRGSLIYPMEKVDLSILSQGKSGLLENNFWRQNNLSMANLKSEFFFVKLYPKVDFNWI